MNNLDSDTYHRMLNASIYAVVRASANHADNRFKDVTVRTMATFASLAEDPVFKTLVRSRDRARMNPALKVASSRAFRRSLTWLTWSQNKFANAGKPYVVIPGNGDLTLEWAHDENVISLTIHEENEHYDSIFYRMNGKRDVIDLNEAHLAILLDEFLLHKNAFTAFKEVAIPPASYGALNPSLETSDFAGRDSSSYAT